MSTTQHPPSPASRAGTDPPTDVQAVSRAVCYANTHGPRFQMRARPSYTILIAPPPPADPTWPLHVIVITNIVWCIAYKREVGGGVVYCPIVVQ